MVRLFRGDGVDANALPIFPDSFELDGASDAGEERVIPALLNVGARHDLRAALTIEDRASGDDLAIANFGAEATPSGIAAVLRRTNTLLGSEELKIENKFHDVTSFL